MTIRATRPKILLSAFVFAGIAIAQTWIQMQILTASNKAEFDEFGTSASLNDKYALIGAPKADPGAVSVAGAAYVFVLSGIKWMEQAILTASKKANDDQFGKAVSITESYALIGAPGTDLGGISNVGAGYVFVRSGTTWIEQAILTASNKATGDKFSESVSLTDNYALIGAQDVDLVGFSSAGAAYVFVRSGTIWTQQAILTASKKAADVEFGSSVSLTDNYALIGSYDEDVDGVYRAGAAYIFVRSGETWTEQAVLTASNKAWDDEFGRSVSLTNDATAFVGDEEDRTYTFTRKDTTWTQIAIANTCCPQYITKTKSYRIKVENQATVGGILFVGRAIVDYNSGESIIVRIEYVPIKFA